MYLMKETCANKNVRVAQSILLSMPFYADHLSLLLGVKPSQIMGWVKGKGSIDKTTLIMLIGQYNLWRSRSE